MVDRAVCVGDILMVRRAVFVCGIPIVKSVSSRAAHPVVSAVVRCPTIPAGLANGWLVVVAVAVVVVVVVVVVVHVVVAFRDKLMQRG